MTRSMVHDSVTSHFITWHLVFHDRSTYSIWNDCCECVNIACALRWGVASIGIFSTGSGSPYMGKHFKCRRYTDERCSFKAAQMKKADLWFLEFIL